MHVELGPFRLADISHQTHSHDKNKYVAYHIDEETNRGGSTQLWENIIFTLTWHLIICCTNYIMVG